MMLTGKGSFQYLDCQNTCSFYLINEELSNFTEKTHWRVRLFKLRIDRDSIEDISEYPELWNT
jgi:hypothetical protein